jgi:hypothetical protein
MKGDFSKLDFRPEENFTGVMHQQGRVLTDQDWNASTDITRYLREMLGLDTIGQDVVGIPAAERDALRVESVTANAAGATVELIPGRSWINGLHVHIESAGPTKQLQARYYGPPIQDPPVDATSIAAGVRDAVILEVWEETFNAFQIRRPKDNPGDPDEFLLEPALGGPDTTERVRLNYALRLLRLEADEDCGNLKRLDDDTDNLGHLTVTPSPTLAVVGDCPVEAEGGYTGFEHYLYRIEVAEPDATGNARFKHSRFNGGLVGRGTFNGITDRVTVLANDQMINQSGLSDFWFEAVAYDKDLGHWRIVMTADATLLSDSVLQLNNISGAWPGGEAFFRLWDGIKLIPAAAGPIDLDPDMGILVEFDPPAPGIAEYRTGDYWTFPARAAGVNFDTNTWPDGEPPQGVIYHRAPLAILNWDAAPPVTISGEPAIHDCRRVFQPLTKLKACCTFRVGDGIHSFGDFDTIQAAIDHLPAQGGEICVLPGVYEENVLIDKDNVKIRGCGPRSQVVSASLVTGGVLPVIRAAGRHNICIEKLGVEAHPDGVGVLIEADGSTLSKDIHLADLEMEAALESAIKIKGAQGVAVLRSNIRMADTHGQWAGVFIQADDVLFEHNTIMVERTPVAGSHTSEVTAGRGGLHIGGTSERVRIIDNLIDGGMGHGITLGTLITVNEDGDVIDKDRGWIVDADDPCDPCGRGNNYNDPDEGPGEGLRDISEGPLYDIRIERNRIHNMGICGIGVIAFFNLDEADEFISVVGLEIIGNTITGCLDRGVEIVDEAVEFIGYGGIALADVEMLKVYDNVIEDNGPSHLDPICGLFVLHGEGIDICRNRITNNGAKDGQDAKDAAKGRRGGIFIVYGVPRLTALEILGQNRPRQDGVPAVRIHDNIVSQPLGQALHIGALGPVSVEGNQLTSRGTLFGLDHSCFWATTVYIVNLGFSNEFYFQTFTFSGAVADPGAVGGIDFDGEFISESDEGLDDEGIGKYMANGNILLADNQIVTDLMEEDISYAISSSLLLTLDDVEVVDNQFDCSFFMIDFLFTNLLALGMTVRINNNRLKETLFLTLFSSIALGLIFNNMSDNQCTHCILNMDSPLSGISWLTTDIQQHSNQVLFNNITFLQFLCESVMNWKGMYAIAAVDG